MDNIFVLLGFVLLIIILLHILAYGSTPNYEKCYTEMQYEGHAAFNLCGGLTGGDKNTEYLNELCVGCPHFTYNYSHYDKNE